MGWKGPAWTQREAREWWETRGLPMVAARQAEEESVSSVPRLDVDVASRVRSASGSQSESESLPEIELESGTRTRVRPPAGGPSGQP